MPKIEPAKPVTFTTVNGQLGAEFQKPLVLTSPPMVTCFPKLSQQALARDQDRGINTLDFSLDLTMTGAREPQLDFKAAIDGFDDLLLEYVFANQAIMGKKGMTKDQVEVMQKRAFRSRVNFKTSRVYPDAMSCRTKGLRELTSMPVVDVNNMQYVPDVVGNVGGARLPRAVCEAEQLLRELLVACGRAAPRAHGAQDGRAGGRGERLPAVEPGRIPRVVFSVGIL